MIHHLVDLACLVTLLGKDLREDQIAAIGEQEVKMRMGGEYQGNDLPTDQTDGEVLKRMPVVILPLSSVQYNVVVVGSIKELLEIIGV